MIIMTWDNEGFDQTARRDRGSGILELGFRLGTISARADCASRQRRHRTIKPFHPAGSPPATDLKLRSGCLRLRWQPSLRRLSRCHLQSYERTPMAHASGPAIENVIPADFVHAPSGVHYRVFSDSNRVWLSFDRPGDPVVSGKRELLYYVGSGRRGLSYLFARDSFLFESPVNWYAHERRWDMAPAYQETREIPLNLPAFTSCLRCHVSAMRAPVKGTENLYPMPPFLHSGVSCERCHGPGA